MMFYTQKKIKNHLQSAMGKKPKSFNSISKWSTALDVLNWRKKENSFSQFLRGNTTLSRNMCSISVWTRSHYLSPGRKNYICQMIHRSRHDSFKILQACWTGRASTFCSQLASTSDARFRSHLNSESIGAEVLDLRLQQDGQFSK